MLWNQAAEEEEKERTEKFLRVARRFFPNCVPFREYVDHLNGFISEPELRISWEASGDGPSKSLHRLIDRLYVAWPSETSYPTLSANELNRKVFLSIDQVLQDVIGTCLRQSPSTYHAQKKNVLCNGFSMGSQHGSGSVLQDLDVRAPSAQIQALRSPGWRLLLRHIGHALLRYLLLQNVLLLSILQVPRTDSSYSRNEPHNNQALSSVFLQLCGPPPRECEFKKKMYSVRSDFNIILKQDLLYHTPTHREDDIIRSIKSSLALGLKMAKTGSPNDGLPRAHHLQILANNANAGKYLLHLIFSQYPNGSLQKEADRNGSQNEKPCTAFDEHAMEMVRKRTFNKRGIGWLRERKSCSPRLRRVLPLLEKVIKKSQSFSLRRLLGQTCPLSTSIRSVKRSIPLVDLLSMHSKPRQVANFLIACTRQLLPTEILGSARNREIFESQIQHLICRRLKGESFNIGRFCTQTGLRLLDVGWLHRNGKNGRKTCNTTDLSFRQARMKQFYCWIFRGVLLPLVHQNFYVTEGDLHRNRLFFFRREVWTHIIDEAHHNMLRTEKKFSILSPEALSECISKRSRVLRDLGNRVCPYPVLQYHHIRFVPKRSSLRGIQRPRGKMMYGFSGPKDRFKEGHIVLRTKGHGMRTIGKTQVCMKKMFRHILRVITSETVRNKSVLGASVFSLDDVYYKFLVLKEQWKESSCPPMFVCCVDIRTSFDTVPLQTLFSDVIPPLLSKERYACMRYLVSRPSITRNGITQRSLIHVCSEPGEEASFSRIVREKLAAKCTGAIFNDLVQITTLTRQQILTCLTEFLMNNVIAIPRRNRKRSETGFAIQSRGLPQGHSLSSLLTSLFYAHVEKQDLSEFLTLDLDEHSTERIKVQSLEDRRFRNASVIPSLLMRQVDDTIYLTSCKEKAVGFLQRMSKGWKSTHGFSVNIGKTRCNFDSGVMGKEEKGRMPWCGLIMNTISMEVTADYGRYAPESGACLRDTLFVEYNIQAGQAFAERARSCFNPKLHPILFDSRINCRATVALNVYQAALLVCLKLSAYATVILPTEKHLRVVAEETALSFTALVHRSVGSRVARSRSCKFPLSSNEVQYLTLHAFRAGISRKLACARKMRSRVKPCVAMLDHKLSEFAKLVQQQRNSRIEALARRICEKSCRVLWSIRL